MRREVALEPDDTAGGGERLVGGVDHGLVLVPLHPLEVLGNDTPRTVVEQRPHQDRNATTFQQVFGNITAGGFQIRNTPCPFGDFGWPVPPVGDVPAGKLRLQIELGVHVSASRRNSIQTWKPVPVLISRERMAKSRRGPAGFLSRYQCFSSVAGRPHG
jgi:hypothetical protein